MNKQIIKFAKKILFPPTAAKKTANSFVRSYFRDHGGAKADYPRNYWSNNKYWDFFFCSLPHVQPSNKFIPRDYHALVVEYALENSRYGDFASEKNYYDKIFQGQHVKIPVTYFKVIDGVLMDQDFHRISEASLYERLDGTPIVIKQTLTSSGVGVRKFVVYKKYFEADGRQYTISDLTDTMGNNIIGQELIYQHSMMNEVNPNSLNTLRMFTYRSVKDNEVHVTLAMLRMGRGDNFVDNVSAGGLAVGINLKTGRMMRYALDKYGNYWDQHPDTNFKFDQVAIPDYWRIIDVTKQLADVLSHSRMIGWDLALSAKGEVVLIEPNIGIGTWMMQVASGTPTFGEFSDEVRDYIRSKGKLL